jgi:phage gpG-like protein
VIPGRTVELNQLGGAIRAVIGPIGNTPPGPVAIPASLGKRMGIALASDMKGHFDRSASPDGSPWAPIGPRPQGGDKPLLNTGKLRASITGQAETDGASAGTNAIQANLMNAGGTIRPVKAKALSIPITREAVRAGSPRVFPRKLVLIKSQKGNVLLVETAPKTKTGKIKKRKQTAGEKSLAARFDGGAEFVVHYVLVPSVTIKARPFNGFTAEAIEDVTGMAMDYLFGEQTVAAVGGAA